jgi:hypothetical protein
VLLRIRNTGSTLHIAIWKEPIVLSRDDLPRRSLLDKPILFQALCKSLYQQCVLPTRRAAEMVDESIIALVAPALDVVLLLALGFWIGPVLAGGKLGWSDMHIGGTLDEHFVSLHTARTCMDVGGGLNVRASLKASARTRRPFAETVAPVPGEARRIASGMTLR